MNITEEIVTRAHAICALAGLTIDDHRYKVVFDAATSLATDTAQSAISECFDRIQPILDKAIVDAAEQGANGIVATLLEFVRDDADDRRDIAEGGDEDGGN